MTAATYSETHESRGGRALPWEDPPAEGPRKDVKNKDRPGWGSGGQGGPCWLGRDSEAATVKRTVTCQLCWD